MLRTNQILREFKHQIALQIRMATDTEEMTGSNTNQGLKWQPIQSRPKRLGVGRTRLRLKLVNWRQSLLFLVAKSDQTLLSGALQRLSNLE